MVTENVAHLELAVKELEGGFSLERANKCFRLCQTIWSEVYGGWLVMGPLDKSLTEEWRSLMGKLCALYEPHKTELYIGHFLQHIVEYQFMLSLIEREGIEAVAKYLTHRIDELTKAAKDEKRCAMQSSKVPR